MGKEIEKGEVENIAGSSCWYRHSLNRRLLVTAGAQHVADRTAAHWLIDEIALTQLSNKKVQIEEFQVWRLEVKADLSAELTCEDGNTNVVYKKNIAYTDFPLSGITFWLTDNTILLPQEY